LLSPSHLVHSEVLRSRRGKATDKGLLIFSICPFSLVVSKAASVAGCDIQFQFMNRDIHCHLCDHAGHSSDHCYQSYESGLRTIYFERKGFLPSLCQFLRSSVPQNTRRRRMIETLNPKTMAPNRSSRSR